MFKMRTKLWSLMYIALVLLSSFLHSTKTNTVEKTLNIQMPNVTPTKDDQYLCISQPAPSEANFVVGYEALANMSVAHHILLYACSEPGGNGVVDCSTPCKGNANIIYAWGLQAPPLTLPANVGFDLGGNTPFKHLGLQVHYLHALKRTDSTGVTLKLTTKVPKYRAGILLLVTGGSIPGSTAKVHLDPVCPFNLDLPIYPFAFRTHAHTLGRTIVAFVWKRGTQEVQEIGRASPQWPQAFYPSHQGLTVSKGDVLMARCTYDSTQRSHTTFIGSTHMDEMCNFYIMYYTSREAPVAGRGNECGYMNDDESHKLTEKMPANSTDYLPDKIPSNFFSQPVVTPSVKLDYHLQEGWHVMAAMGQVSGVSLDSQHGHVVVFHRASRVWDGSTFKLGSNYRMQDPQPISNDTVLHVNAASGAVELSWGKGLFMLPHGIHVDAVLGHVWVTDVGAHVVQRFDYGKWTAPTLTLGVTGTAGSDQGHFCEPADVATNAKGEVFVADGYCNSRIMKFSPTGKFLKEWGSSKGTFQIVHSLVVIDELQWVCVADRQRAAVECFDFEGTPQKRMESTLLGDEVFTVTWNGADKQLLGAAIVGSLPTPQRGFGFSISSVSTEPHIQWWNPSAVSSDLVAPHDLCVSKDGNEVFVAQLGKPGVTKLVLTSDQFVPSSTMVHHTDPFSALRRSTFLVNTKRLFYSHTARVIGLSLVVPAVIIVALLVVIRLYRSSKTVTGVHSSESFRSLLPGKSRRFGGTVAFQPLQQEESDMEETSVGVNTTAENHLEPPPRRLRNGHNL